MPTVGIGRYSDFLRRFFGVAGEAFATGRELNPDVQAVIELHAQPEFYFLQGEKICAGRVISNAAVGLISCARLFNPSGSGILVVIEELWGFRVGADAVVQLGNGVFTAGAGSSSQGQRDLRWTGAPQFKPQTGTVTVPVGIGDFQTLPFLAASRSWVRYPGKLVIAPGTQFLVFGDTPNETIEISLCWRERALTPGELDVAQ